MSSLNTFIKRRRRTRAGVTKNPSPQPNHAAAPSTRPIRGSVDNPHRPRRRRPWVPILSITGKVVGEEMKP